jgi:hypothetical protein
MPTKRNAIGGERRVKGSECIKDKNSADEDFSMRSCESRMSTQSYSVSSLWYLLGCCPDLGSDGR